MNNKRKVFVYQNNSGLGCLGCVGALIIIGLLLTFFTQLAAVFLPPLLFIGSIVVGLRTAYQLWQWHKQSKKYDEGGFVEENGLIIPIADPDYSVRDALRLRLVYAVIIFVIAALILQVF